MIRPPIIQYPDFEQTFVLTTDAFALVAVLSQVQISEDRTMSFASRSPIRNEKNKPVIEKELLGIYWSIPFFTPYLSSRKFVVVTDNIPQFKVQS